MSSKLASHLMRGSSRLYSEAQVPEPRSSAEALRSTATDLKGARGTIIYLEIYIDIYSVVE